MPDPNKFDNQDDFMGECVPKMMQEGKDNDQATAACMSMWKERKSFYGMTMAEAVKHFLKRNTSKSVMACLDLCNWCVSACTDCARQCAMCPNADSAEHQACMQACKDCMASCQLCAAACATGDLTEIERSCMACVEACAACQSACEAVAAMCENCKDVCTACASSCQSCNEECKRTMGGDKPMAMKNALKALGETDEELIVGNHIVLFGGRDLTGYAIGKNADGSLGEYFTKTTDLESDYTKTGRLYVDLEHGRDPDDVGNTKHNILGYVDWKTKTIDDEGVFVKRVLYRRNKYVKMLEPLIRAGLIGNSSEAVPDDIQKADNGEILKWGLHRDTLTVTPMEPRMLDENAMAAVKALSNVLPHLKSLLTSKDTALTVEEEQPTPAGHAGKPNQPTQREIHKENKTMDELEIKKAIADAFAEREAQAKAQAEAKASHDAELKAVADAAYKQALEDIRANPAKTFYHSTEPANDDNDGVQAFKHWMGTGQVNQGLIRPTSEFMKAGGSYFLGSEGKAAWNVSDGGTGGYLVPDPLYNQIISKRNIASWVRQLPCQYFETPADHILVPRESTSMTDFVKTAEAASYDENEGDVTQKDVVLYKYTKLTKVSEEFLMYNGTNWESWFANALGRAVAGTENTIFTTATGTNEPEGVLNGATVANTTATTDIILPSELSTLIGYLGGGYNVPAECGMLMANVTKWYLLGTGGTSVAPFAFAGTPQEPFFGYKAVVDDDLEPYTTASAKCVLFGNMSYYAVAEKPGMIVQRNPYLYQATGQIGIFASIFRGGGVLQSEAFYYLTNKST